MFRDYVPNSATFFVWFRGTLIREARLLLAKYKSRTFSLICFVITSRVTSNEDRTRSLRGEGITSIRVQSRLLKSRDLGSRKGLRNSLVLLK